MIVFAYLPEQRRHRHVEVVKQEGRVLYYKPEPEDASFYAEALSRHPVSRHKATLAALCCFNEDWVNYNGNDNTQEAAEEQQNSDVANLC